MHGLIVKPPGYVAGQRYPTMLWIHGGPNGQDDHSLELSALDRLPLRAAVLRDPRLRGAGGQLSRRLRPRRPMPAIAGDWGHKEVEDLLAGVDYAVAMGVADPQPPRCRRLELRRHPHRLHHRQRRTASRRPSAAPAAPTMSMYGADQYILQYDNELGPPWKNPAAVAQGVLSRSSMRTGSTRPTLFMGGDEDFNVPIIGGEQMYQALKSLGPCRRELVVYPGPVPRVHAAELSHRPQPALPGVDGPLPQGEELDSAPASSAGRSDQCALRNTQAPPRRSARAVK